MSDALAELRALQKIQRILTSYPRAIDRLDVDLLKSLYHEDARDDHAAFKGTAWEFADYVIPYLRETFVATMHHVTHSNINVDGARAVAESYYYAWHRLEGDYDKVARFFGEEYAARVQREDAIQNGHDFICLGRYIDLFEERNGEWKIAHREITVEGIRIEPATPVGAGGEIAQIVADPRRDRTDIIYRFLSKLS